MVAGLSRISHWKDMDPYYVYPKSFIERMTQLGFAGISLSLYQALNLPKCAQSQEFR